MDQGAGSVTGVPLVSIGKTFCVKIGHAGMTYAIE